MADPVDATTASDEVRAYKIHIPTKHLELTRRKLELTRLPHETSPSSSPSGWWEPKPQIESLVDFWLEKYSWRDQESVLNTSAPQFRTALPCPGLPAPGLRLHFIHVRSASASAVPLLLLPPFPLTAHALTHLIQPLTTPSDPSHQPFHLVLPTLPSLGFSDALPSTPATNPIAASAALLDALMRRLGYPRYVASTAAPGPTGPAHIDWRLVRRLAAAHADSCVAAHWIAPVLREPALRAAPWAWVRWRVAKLLGGGLGYSSADVRGKVVGDVETAAAGGWPRLGEPNGLAYALCDSPVGMLVFAARALGGGDGFAPERIITMAKLAWLPGPEHVLRFWAGRSKVGITVFGEGKGDGYAAAEWAGAEFDVVNTRCLPGRTEEKGLLAFEHPEVVCEGVRELVKAVLAKDLGAFSATGLATAGVVPLEGVIVEKAGEAAPSQGRAAVTPTPSMSPPKGNGSGRVVALPTLGMSPIQEKEEGKFKEEKGKGKEEEVGEGEPVFTPPPQIPVRDPLVDGESPDTLVEGSKTPPLDKAAP
ncbi:Alpha/Beta hydrolase protein [Schizothecium vesticola]|uniref:Alpha/Beta hydrolase protein n=1 Tax=Schizothecium vesticola TaxID=314040 RepID=A0AA40F6Z0_9PEZI|nr:Alpha/Beta hydrolase protein [Schizothecium vesticola]